MDNAMECALVQSIRPGFPHCVRTLVSAPELKPSTLLTFPDIADHATWDGIGVDPAAFLFDTMFCGEAVVCFRDETRLVHEHLKCAPGRVCIQESAHRKGRRHVIRVLELRLHRTYVRHP